MRVAVRYFSGYGATRDPVSRLHIQSHPWPRSDGWEWMGALDKQFRPETLGSEVNVHPVVLCTENAVAAVHTSFWTLAFVSKDS